MDFVAGTDDHSEQVTADFDTGGQARFALVRRGAANGTHQEERVYYDASGAVVGRRITTVRGPGYPFDSLQTPPRLTTWPRDLCG
jgi:hypothetical protein